MKTPGIHKNGRPLKNVEADITRITFRVNKEELAILERLASELDPSIRGKMSVVIRKLILEAK